MGKVGERVWFVTGCSTGIGQAFARVLTERGERALISARRRERIAQFEETGGGRIRAVALDIADKAAVAAAVKTAIDAFGRIDVLLNNAGVGSAGAIEEVSDEETRGVFETNVFGTLNVIRAVLPQMREQARGHILTVTSVGGFRGGTSTGIYSGSKFALEGMHEAMANELPPLGIKVTLLQPGLVKTDFRHRSIGRAKQELPAYAATSGRIRAGLDTPYPVTAAEPAQVAHAIVRFVDSGKSPLRVQFGADAVAGIRAKLDSVIAELAEWEAFANESGGSADALKMYSEAAAAAKSQGRADSV